MFFVSIDNRLECHTAKLSVLSQAFTCFFCHLKNLCISFQFPTNFLFLLIFVLQKKQQNHYF